MNYTLEIKDRDSFHFEANAIRGSVLLAHMIKKETDKLNIP